MNASFRCLMMTGVVACLLSPAIACTAVVAGKGASATGRVLIGHNDDSTGTFLRHAMLPRRGEKAAMFWSEVKHPKGGEKVAHTFYNEYGVIVMSNNGGVMNEWDGEKFDLPDEGTFSTVTGKGIDYDLRVRAIETAHSARECVDRLTELVANVGYTQNARNFLVADCDEAWIVEVIRGRRFVARRVPDAEVVVYPNCLVFNRLHEGDLASENMKSQDGSFDVIATYQGPRTWKSPYNLHRWQDMYRLVAGVDVPVGEAYPFSVRPSHPVSIDDIKRGLCSHYEGRPYEVKDRHPPKSPKTIAPICRGTTIEAMVCALGATPEETEIHLTVGRPCEVPYGVYRPFAGVLPPDTVFGRRAVERLEHHQRPPADRVQVAVYAGHGPRGNGFAEWLRLLSISPEVDLTVIDSELLRAGALDAMDVLVVPGGDARTLKKDIDPEGGERIRTFVARGGGYIGTCAGCCLALDERADPERGIGLIPFRRIGNKGQAQMPVAINEKGANRMGVKTGVYELRYSKGPVLEPLDDRAPDRSFEVWGTYAGEIVEKGRPFAMNGAPAIVGGTYGKGRVFACACHPESYVSSRGLVVAAFRFVTNREISFPSQARKPGSIAVGYFTPALYGVSAAQGLLALAAEKDLDLVPISTEDMERNALDHLDVIVFPEGERAVYGRDGEKLKRHLSDFVSRGGMACGWGAGTDCLPKGAPVCANFGAIFRLVKGLAE